MDTVQQEDDRKPSAGEGTTEEAVRYRERATRRCVAIPIGPSQREKVRYRTAPRSAAQLCAVVDFMRVFVIAVLFRQKYFRRTYEESRTRIEGGGERLRKVAWTWSLSGSRRADSLHPL